MAGLLRVVVDFKFVLCLDVVIPTEEEGSAGAQRRIQGEKSENAQVVGMFHVDLNSQQSSPSGSLGIAHLRARFLLQ